MKFRSITITLLGLLIILSALYLSLGNQTIPLDQLFGNSIVLSLRLPRLILVLGISILLSTAGLLIQMMTGNPMAEMSTLGLSGGSSLALSLLMLSTLPNLFALNLIFSVIGSALCLILVLFFTANSKFQPSKLILVGTSVGLFSSSLASSLSFAHNDAQSYLRWIVGSFSAANWTKSTLVWIFIPVLLALVLLFSKSIFLLTLGDELAQSLGVNVQRMRILLVGLVALMTGLSVALSGVISFVGLIAPQIAQMLEKKNFRKILALSNLVAANFLLAADFLARNLFRPYEFPAGALTLLVGSPFFLSLLLRKEKKPL